MPRFLCSLSVAVLLALPLTNAETKKNKQGSVINEAVPAWVEQLQLPAELDPETDDNPVQTLVVDRQIHLEKKQRFEHFVIRLSTQDAVQENAEVEFHFDPTYQKAILHYVRIWRGKKKLDRLSMKAIRLLDEEENREIHLYDGRKTASLVLEDVHPGDILEYAYTIEGANPVFEGHFAYLYIQRWSVPVTEALIRIVCSRERPLRSLAIAGATLPDERPLPGGMRELRWRASAIPESIPDSDLPPNYMAFPTVQFADYPDWKSVALWARKLFKTDEALPKDLAPDLAAIKAQARIEDRIVAALRFVQDKFRYLGVMMGSHTHEPYSLSKIAERRFGDCKDKSVLLTAILRDMGIEAWPAMVSTDVIDAPQLSELPTPFAFDHAVVVVRMDGVDYWVDPTSSMQRGRLDTRHFPDYGWGLVLREGEDCLTRVRPGGLQEYKTEVEQSFVFPDYGGAGSFTVRTTTYGRDADRARRLHSSVQRSRLEKEYLDYYSKRYPGITRAQSLKTVDDEEQNIFVVEEKYILSDTWQPGRDKGKYLSSWFYPDEIKSALKIPQTRNRRMPFYRGEPTRLIEKIEITMPEDWSFGPVRGSVEEAGFQYLLTADYDGNKIRLIHSFESTRRQIEAGETAAYVAGINRILEQLSYDIWIDEARRKGRSGPGKNSEIPIWGL